MADHAKEIFQVNEKWSKKVKNNLVPDDIEMRGLFESL